MTFNKTVLPSGMRIITIPMPDNPSVTVLVMVETGSKYEDEKTNGISHFLEHMAFKGTTKRPKSIEITRELDSIGSHYNAFTGQEFTGYYAKANSKHFEKILDVISDLYVDPLFNEAEMKKEKGVIVEEIRMYKDVPQHRVQDLFMETVYGNQPAGWNIAGTEEKVRSFTRDELIKYRTSHYVSGATTVVISGSFDEASAIKAVSKAFEKVSPSKKKGKEAVNEKQDRPICKTEFKETDQTHLVLGVRTFSINDKRIPAMHVLSAVLGKGMSSRLFFRLRDELGICYYVKTDHNPFTDHGILTISAGLDNSRVKEGIKEILAQCHKLKEELVSEEEIKKAKDSFSGTTLLELETSDSRAEYAGYQEAMKGKIETPDELLAKINKVTSEDVRKLANEIFTNEKLNLALIGRFKDGKELEDVIRFD